jgi:hypothetical protein
MRSHFVPEAPIRIRAYLAEGVRPTKHLIIGLDAIRQYFDLHTGPHGDFLSSPSDVRVPLMLLRQRSQRYPDFTAHRLCVPILVETQGASSRKSPLWPYAIIDTGAPYSIIPHAFHSAVALRIHEDYGKQPYAVLSEEERLTQRLVLIGIRFLVQGQ